MAWFRDPFRWQVSQTEEESDYNRAIMSFMSLARTLTVAFLSLSISLLVGGLSANTRSAGAQERKDGGSAEPFQAARPGYLFDFPADHASHPDFRTEWWYYTGHLWVVAPDGDGRGTPMAPEAPDDGVPPTPSDLGFQLTFFRSGVARPDPPRPSAWALNDLYFAHLAISDFSGRRFHLGERLMRDALALAGADSMTYRVWIDDWEVALEPDGSHRLVADEPGEDGGDGHGLDLRLTPLKPPALHGEAGLSRKGAAEGEASHYYSLTRLSAEGTVRLGERTLGVRGEAWMDHEFATGELAPDLVGWDWFGLQLDDGSELMLYTLRRADGTAAAASSASLIERAGLVSHLTRGDFVVEVVRRWTSPESGATYPASWRLRVPEAGLVLDLEPRLADQELVTPGSTAITYWEGAVSVGGTRRGKPISGRGYVELTGYAGSFRARM
jgi:predicted secreted hydrolase